MLARQIQFAEKRLALAEEEKRSVALACRQMLVSAGRGVISKDPNAPMEISVPAHFSHLPPAVAEKAMRMANLYGKTKIGVKKIEFVPPEKAYTSQAQKLRHINAKIAAEKEQTSALVKQHECLLYECGMGDGKPLLRKKKLASIEQLAFADGKIGKYYYAFGVEPPPKVEVEEDTTEMCVEEIFGSESEEEDEDYLDLPEELDEDEENFAWREDGDDEDQEGVDEEVGGRKVWEEVAEDEKELDLEAVDSEDLEVVVKQRRTGRCVAVY